jgi:hypothetical protein
MFSPNPDFGDGRRGEERVAAYTLFTHRHRFAAWAAARAAQRGFTSVEKLMEALEGCGVVEFASRVGKRRVSEAEYDAEHARWCERIMAHLKRRRVKNVTFGRAAKLVAVYLKTMIVIGPDGSSPIAGVLHPPIDRILLRSLARDPEVPRPIRREWARLNWTTLDKRGYSRLIRQLRDCLGKGKPLWHLERHWIPSG